MRLWKTWPNLGMELLGGLAATAVVLGGLMAAGALIFGASQANRITSQLTEIQTSVHAWATGCFSRRISLTGDQEITELGRDLNLMAEELDKALALRQEMGALRERHRVARDLHDLVKQHIFAASMQLGALSEYWSRGDWGKSAELSLQSARRLIQESQAELHGVIEEFRPPETRRANLSESCQRTLDLWMEYCGLEVRNGVLPGICCSQAAERVFRSVLQESLSNISRHSRARRAEISLTRRGAYLQLKVMDDGRGLAKDRGAGMGLVNMRKRAESLPEGSLAIESEPGMGVQVILACRDESV